MERAIDVARYICDEYRKLSGEAIDEMKLHKLLYFSQRESFAITGEPLFMDDFQGWKFGPVCVAVRNAFCLGEIIGHPSGALSASSAYLVKNIIMQYGELASWKLSQISHAETSWINSRKGFSPDDHGGAVLSLEDIRKDAEKVRPYDSLWDMYLDEFEDDEDEV